MVEKSPDYVFLSDFYVVKPLGLGAVGVMVTILFEQKNVTSSKLFLLLYLILIILYSPPIFPTSTVIFSKTYCHLTVNRVQRYLQYIISSRVKY